MLVSQTILQGGTTQCERDQWHLGTPDCQETHTLIYHTEKPRHWMNQ